MHFCLTNLGIFWGYFPMNSVQVRNAPPPHTNFFKKKRRKEKKEKREKRRERKKEGKEERKEGRKGEKT